MDRRRFLNALGGIAVVGLGGQTTALSAALGQLGERLGAPAGDTPTRSIDTVGIAKIMEIADLIERRAHVIGGDAGSNPGEEFDTAMRSVTAVQRVLAADHSGTVNRELYIAAGWLFRAVGFMAFDTNRLTIAQDLLSAAQECAAHAGCASLEARVLGTRARQEAWSGDPAVAVQLLNRAVHLQGLTSREQAMLYALQARALGRMGFAPQALRAVGESDQAMMHVAPGDTDDRPWVGFFNLGHQQGDTGRALLDLALSAGADVPADVIADSGSRHRASLAEFDLREHRRSMAFTYLNLAATQVLAGAPDEALTIGNNAIGVSVGIRSHRVDEHLRLVGDVCAIHGRGNRSTGELREAIGDALVAGT